MRKEQSFTMESLIFVPKVKVLLKATSDDKEPTQGHFYDEINAISLESSALSYQLVDFLSKRLQKQSCHVKLKVLKVMTYVVSNGSEDFRQALRKNSAEINAASNHSGEPDAFHNYSFYQQIRSTAQNLLEILFDTEVTKTTIPSLPSSSFIASQGIGSSPGMGGFGNTQTASNKTFSEKLFSTLAPRSITSAKSEPLKSSQINVTNPSATVTAHLRSSSKSITTRKHIPGRAGGGWEEDDEIEKHTVSSGSDGLQTAQADILKESDWSEELNVINECLNKQGDNLLTLNDINNFISKCLLCNCDKILEIVNTKLEQSVDNQVHLIRCLQLIEHMMNTDFLTLEHLTETCLQNLQSVYTSTDKPIHFKAKKILLSIQDLTKQTNMLPIISAPQ